jgi:uncharacterized iron-regulated protein
MASGFKWSNMIRWLPLAFVLAVTLGLHGCITSGPRGGTADYTLHREGDVDRLAQKLADSRIVFIGETHTRMDHHRLQLAIIEALHDRGRDLAIGVEWFQYPMQGVLNDYIADRIDEATLLDRSEWYERWRFDYRLYGDIIEFAKKHQIPVIALNAPVELTSAISEQGLEKVRAGRKHWLPESYDYSNEAYKEQLLEVYKLHRPSPHGSELTKEDEASFARFLDVQLTWDETMAEKSAAFLADNPEKTLVVLAGAGHIAYGAGIPDRLQRRLPLTSKTVLPADYASAMPGSAEIFVATRAETLERSGLLGVFLADGRQGLTITAFSDDSGAKDAGLRIGDTLVRVEGKDTPNLAALKLVLGDHPPGTKVRVEFEAAQTGHALKSIEQVYVTLR